MRAPHELPELEARVLAAAISEPEMLTSAFADVETADFVDFHAMAAWEALRNVQAAGEPIGIPAITQHIEQRDLVRDTFVSEKVDAAFLAYVVKSAPMYDSVDEALGDATKLRTLRGRRERGDVVAAITGDPLAAADAAAREIDDAFISMPARVVDERAERMKLAARALHYHIPFLDDALRVILPHDLVLLGAEPGLGKTELALSIAQATVMAERRAAYFALEAEPLELERRLKFGYISARAYERNLEGKHELNYVDWYIGNCDHVVGDLNEEAERWFLSKLGGLLTFYRGEKFGQEDLTKRILEVHKRVDLIVVDHLHYVDLDADTNEARAVGALIKAIRDISLRIGKPILLVAHLRKKDERLKKVIPSIYDFHGSSEITKVCTQAITIARANFIDPPKWYVSPTLMSVLKDRRAGATPLVALTMYDRRTRSYEDKYSLGRLIKGGTEWEQLKPGEDPSWARCNRQMELEFTS